MIWTKQIRSIILALTIAPVISLSVIASEYLPQVDIMSVEDFSQLAQTARNEKKLIMLEVSASYCSFCMKLEEEIIKPMLRSGDYDANVLIRKIDIDGYGLIRDFKGKSVTADELSRQLKVMVTPTLIFLNSENQEVSKRIVGVNSLDYFGSYVDGAIEHGLASIR